MIDIDFFKRINDTYGHRAGDQTLRAMAKILRQSCRSSDVIGRYGGEEFCVLLPDTTEDDALLWAERVRKVVASTKDLAGNLQIQVTASFGVAQRLADTNSPERLVDLADQALLVAKRSGRDRAVGFQTISSNETIRAARGSLVAIFQELTAKDVMTTILASLSQDDSVGVAVRYFLRFRFHSAPVVDQDGMLVGILSERDVMASTLLPNWWRTKIQNVMKRNVVCYDEDTPVLTIYEFLCRVSIRGVVIVKDGQPTGMISRASLLRWFSNLVVANPSALASDEAEEYPEAGRTRTTCEPREKINLLAKAIAREASLLNQSLVTESSELLPAVVGGVSRIEELLNDMLSFTRDLNTAVDGFGLAHAELATAASTDG